MADQQKIKKIQSVIQDNTFKAEDQIRELTNALEAERRKSMADEKRMKDIERALNEKVYFLNELTRRKSEDEKELNMIREELEKERKKSLADEATIRKYEALVKEKEKELMENNRIRMKNDN